MLLRRRPMTQQRRRGIEVLAALLDAYVRRRREAHAALAAGFSTAVSDPLLVDLPRSGVLAGDWSFRKHGAGTSLVSSSGEVIDLTRLDRYKDGEIIPIELSQYLESVGVDVVELDGEVLDVRNENEVGRLAGILERAGVLERCENGWVLVAGQPA
jgi:hypothetical protein